MSIGLYLLGIKGSTNAVDAVTSLTLASNTPHELINAPLLSTSIAFAIEVPT